MTEASGRIPRARLRYRLLDAVMTGSLRSRRGLLKDLRSLVSPRSSRYARVASLAALVSTLVPGARRLLSKLLFRPESLPFETRRVEFLDHGSGATVFVLETSCGLSVLKAYRRTIGQSSDSLLQLEATYRGKYETVSCWYAGPFDIVTPARFLVLHGPLMRRPVVACVQPYIAGTKHDLFEDFDDGDLARMSKEDDSFRDRVSFFARRTLDLVASRGLCVDLLGVENLLVVRDGGSWSLKLIDYGIFELASLERDSPAVLSRLRSRLRRLRSFLETASRLVEGSPEEGEAFPE